MTLRARLTIFFAGIVIVPLLAATVVIQNLVKREIETRADTRLRLASNTVSALWSEQLARAESELLRVAPEIRDTLAGDQPGARLQGIRATTDLDFLVVVGPDGRVLGADVGRAAFFDTFRVPGPRELAARRSPAGVLRSRVELGLADGEATLAGGWFADAQAVADLRDVTGLGVAIVEGRHVLVSSMSPPPRVPAESGPVEMEEGGWALVTRVAGESGGVLLVAPPEEGSGASIWLVTLGGLLVVTSLGYLLAVLISRPMQRLTEAAASVAAGNFDARVDVGEGGDVARLAESFNAMTSNLRAYVGELERSRDEARRALDRLGTTLRSTHDLEAMLGVILDTAVGTLGAKAGALYLLTPARELKLEVAHGYVPPRGGLLDPGEGIAGLAVDGDPVLVSANGETVPRGSVEPKASTALAVPLMRGERVMGVLALYGRLLPEPFQEHDADTLASFGAQASVAIENVLLHQEAQRLSITDGLTGVWNRRYLQFTLAKEIERAQRFGRPLSVMMIDIDHFKSVNDEHGHQRGDEVLIEVTRRMMGSIRTQIDTLARYGGEEFVIVLPETPPEGTAVVADKVLSVIRRDPFTSDTGPDVDITVSAGVASFPEDGSTADELVGAADRAMYRAKAAGRDRVVAGA